MRLILFDIDGTLLWTDGAGRRAIQQALVEEMGTAGPIDTYRFDGKTDPQIVRELMTLAEHPEAEDEERIAAVCRRYVGLLTAELQKPPRNMRLLPGVGGAALKLAAVGLDPARFAVGAYGSDSARRPELPAIAADRATQRTGRTFSGADIVIVGDTPDDVACARPIGARTVAVATGFYDVTKLRATGAAYVFENLTDTPAVTGALLG